MSVLQFDTAHAADQIVNRSLTLQTGTISGLGGSTPGSTTDTDVDTVNHRFDVQFPSVGSPNVGSILMQYCTTATGTCTKPTDLHTNNTNLNLEGTSGLASQSFGSVFTYVNTTDGAPYLTRVASALAADTTANWVIENITNPSDVNTTFYVRLSTYASTDTTGTAIDSGVVAASTADPIILTGVMPESLIFCTGETVDVSTGANYNHADASIPDCTTATSGAGVTFDIEFTPADTATATSQMSASTNAGTGYIIQVFGNTLESGANSIAALAAQTAPLVNTPQFGMNLVENTTTFNHQSAGNCPNDGAAGPYPCPLGVDVDDTPNAGLLQGEPDDNYDDDDLFRFASGDEVAASDNALEGTNVASDSQIYTVSYIVNVPGSQAAGTYTTTLTYVCTATF